MKLQISFDSMLLEESIEKATLIAQYADIIEVGTLPILKHGSKAVERFREAFPQATILADTKIIDRGRDIVSLFAQAGADWISVMAGTHKEVIHGVCSKAHDMGKKVMLDMLDTNSAGQKALEAQSLGIDAIMFHQMHAQADSALFLEEWSMIQGNTNLPIFISSKTGKDLDQITSLNPYALVIGNPITTASDFVIQAQFFYEICKNK